jgi:hypothetical protein
MSGLQFLRQTQVLPSTPRARRCCKTLTGLAAATEVIRRGERYSWSNLARCESSWCCPLCTRIAARLQADRVARTLDNLREATFAVQFVTLTCRHTSRDALAWLMERMTAARRAFFHSRAWRRYARTWDFLGTVRAWEVTHGFNGWHAHTHEFLAFKAYPFGLIDLYPLTWAKACERVGLYASKSFGTQVDPVHATTSFNAARYACSWGPGDELTAAPFKTAKVGNRTVWDLQRAALYGSDEALDRWTEFCTATAGRKRLSWTGALRGYIAPELDPPAPTGTPVEATDLDPEAWHALLLAGQESEVLDLLAAGRYTAAQRILHEARGCRRNTMTP